MSMGPESAMDRISKGFQPCKHPRGERVMVTGATQRCEQCRATRTLRHPELHLGAVENRTVFSRGFGMNDNERYEIKAEAFYRMTGLMAPGKDPGMVVVNHETRHAVWRVWNDAYGPCIAAMLEAASEVLNQGGGE